jgi:hypothetical protein
VLVAVCKLGDDAGHSIRADDAIHWTVILPPSCHRILRFRFITAKSSIDCAYAPYILALYDHYDVEICCSCTFSGFNTVEFLPTRSLAAAAASTGSRCRFSVRASE